MKKAMFTALAGSFLCSFLCSSLALASGTSSAGRDSPPSALDVTETVRCTVLAIRDDGTIIVRDGEGKPAKVMPYSEKTRFSAQDKKAFGKKKISVADLEVGHQLKVTMRPATGETLRVKVLKEG